MMLKIESAQNQTFKKFLSLTSAKGLKKEKLLLLSGEKLIGEFLINPQLTIAAEIIRPGLKRFEANAPHDGQLVELSPTLFSSIDVLGTHFNILVVEQPKIAVLEEQNLDRYLPQGIEVVIPISDPGNLGALIRSCEAFGIKRAILTHEAAHPFLPKAIKASAGSVLRVPMTRGPALSTFPDHCIGLDMKGLPINQFVWPACGLLVVGEEGLGLGACRFKHRIRISTQGVESLNAVVAASIALAHRANLT
jgi:RNA methyltransferase, TrmH family